MSEARKIPDHAHAERRRSHIFMSVLTIIMASAMPSILAAQVVTPMIAAALTQTLVLLPNGTVMVCGVNSVGQLGLGPVPPGSLVTTFQQIPASNLSSVTAIATGRDHSLALLSNGTVKAWGFGSAGELGLGTTSLQNTPQQIPASNLSNVIAVAAGTQYSLALLANGTVKSWGENTGGQLGLGFSGAGTNQSTPQQIPLASLSNVVAIAAGEAHSAALLSNGTVKVWGYNSLGQLGLGNIGNQCTPQQIPASRLRNVVAISAGGAHSLALCSGGQVVVWGDNSFGQYGLGCISGQGAAHSSIHGIPLSSLNNVAAISAGGSHSLALLSDGTVKTWGYNGNGGLGIGPIPSPYVQTTPLQVPTNSLSNVSSLCAGYFHSLSLLSDGTVKAWGANSLGQLGLGIVPDQYFPQFVTGLCLAGVSTYTMQFGLLGNAALGMTVPCNSVTSGPGGQLRYFNAFSTNSLNAAIPGGGAWYGLHTTQAEVLSWLNWGANGFPLAMGPLSSIGGAAVSVSIPPGSLSGLTIYGVSVAFHPVTLTVVANSAVTSHTF